VDWRRVAWAELGFVTLLAGGALAYLVEARGVSLNPANLLLLQPTALLVLALWVVIALGCLRPAASGTPAESWADFGRSAAMVGAFGLFILSMDRVGFDVAIYGFTLAGIALGGERRLLPLLLLPPIFTLAVIHGFRWLIPYPFPTTLL
jgi:hypothetical protein